MGIKSLNDIDFNTKGGVKNSNETIDYSASAEPTQSGNTVTKTNNWVLQYLVQGVNWLKSKKQDIISDLTTIRSNATNGNTAYRWGNHANAGYAKTSDIPNPTANAIEITNLKSWFNPNNDKYIIPPDLMYELLSGNISMSELLLASNGASCTLTCYEVDFKSWGVDMRTLLSNLIKKAGYNVYVENDIDSITTSGVCTLKFKIDGTNVIIECYKKYV